METGQMALAFAVARYRKMVAEKLPDFQQNMVERYGDLITRQMRKLNKEQILRINEMAKEFEDVV